MRIITFILLVSLFASCDNSNHLNDQKANEIERLKKLNNDFSSKISNDSHKIKYNKLINLWQDLLGKNIFNIRLNDEFSDGKTIEGTNNAYWITYYSTLNITIVSVKKTDKIINVFLGRVENPNIFDLNRLFEIKDKKLPLSDFHNYISSITYGSTEQLSEYVCINKDCIEYWTKKDITTQILYEFDDSGDYATLKKIIHGKSKNLDSFDMTSRIPTIKTKPLPVRNNKFEVDGEIIGVWYSAMKYLEGYELIVKKSNKFFKYKFKSTDDNDPIIKDLIKISDKRYNVDFRIGSNVSSDYLIINKSGDLEFWDDQGYFFTAKKDF